MKYLEKSEAITPPTTAATQSTNVSGVGAPLMKAVKTPAASDMTTAIVQLTFLDQPPRLTS